MEIGVVALGNDNLDVLAGLGVKSHRVEVYPDEGDLRVAVVLSAAKAAALEPCFILKLERRPTVDAAKAHTTRVLRYAQQIGLRLRGLEPCNEPDAAGLSSTKVAALGVAVYETAQAMGFTGRVYAGGVRNLGPADLRYLQAMRWDTLPAGLAVAVHRYSHHLDPANAHGAVSRAAEWANLRSVVGARPTAVTEVGYHLTRSTWGRWWWKGSKQLTNEQAAACLTEELRLFSSFPLPPEAVYVYEWNGPPGGHELDYSIRNPDGSLRPQAEAIRRWIAAQPVKPSALPGAPKEQS